MSNSMTDRDTPASPPPGTLTGRRVLMIFIAFFGTIMAVNFYMAKQAIGTFGGVVVDNSYVASQQYNGWLAEARAQKALGWSETIRRSPSGIVSIALKNASGEALHGAKVTAVAQHPLGRAKAIDLIFAEGPGGDYIAPTPLPDGRWQLRFTIRHAGSTKNVVENLNGVQ